MSNSESKNAKLPSLADYLVRHDLMAMLEEARFDYNQASAGGPRHLNQKEISSRFAAPPKRPPGQPPP